MAKGVAFGGKPGMGLFLDNEIQEKMRFCMIFFELQVDIHCCDIHLL